MIFLNEKSSVLELLRGLLPAEELIKIARRISEYQRIKNLLQDKCNQACSTVDSIRLINVLTALKLYRSAYEMAYSYFIKREGKISSELEWEMVSAVFMEPDSLVMYAWLPSINLLSNKFGEDNVKDWLTRMFEYNFQQSVLELNTSRLHFALQLLDLLSADKSPAFTERMKVYYQMKYYEKTSNWNRYFETGFESLNLAQALNKKESSVKSLSQLALIQFRLEMYHKAMENIQIAINRCGDCQSKNQLLYWQRMIEKKMTSDKKNKSR